MPRVGSLAARLVYSVISSKQVELHSTQVGILFGFAATLLLSYKYDPVILCGASKFQILKGLLLIRLKKAQLGSRVGRAPK